VVADDREDGERMATLTATQAQLLIEPNFAVVATVRADGGPHSTVVWIDWDGENAVFNTTTVRAKGVHLARDPRVSIAVWDRDDPYRSLELQGRAELDFEGADEHIASLARKYGRDTYARGNRVIVRVRPERVHTYGLD
jgi:PPOX class probable F420-dependent enzyme